MKWLGFLDALIGAGASTPELFVECALFIDGVLFGLPTRTRYGWVLESVVERQNLNLNDCASW